MRLAIIQLVQDFLAKLLYNTDLAPCDFWLFPDLKSTLKGRINVNTMFTQYTSSVNGVSLPSV
jgi:hypothetical protein